MDDLYSEFIEFIKKHRLIKEKEKILTAYSGGQDSSVLLWLMKRASMELNFEIKACYFNHHLRGEESEREEQFIIRTAEDWNIPLVKGEGNVSTFSRENKYSIEEAARILRYRFFEEIKEKYFFDKVATGHQLDDHQETILSNFLRGTSLKGLSGIPIVRLPYIRPLHFASREKIHHYADSEGIPFFEDSTNLQDRYFRNNIRLNLVPYLETNFHKGIKNILAKYGKLFHDAHEVLDQIAVNEEENVFISLEKNKITLDIVKFNNYFNIIKKYILSGVFIRLGIEERGINSSLMESVIFLLDSKKKKKLIDLSGTVSCYIDYPECVFFIRNDEEFEYSVSIGKTIKADKFGFEFSSQIIEDSPENKNWKEVVDFCKLKGPLVLRNWRKGDRFIPLGMREEKKLSDFFIDEKVPVYARKQIPLLVANNEIVWICGFRISETIKLTANTEKKLGLNVKYFERGD